MPNQEAPARYGAVAQLLHWVIAVLIAIQFALFWLEDDLPLGSHKLALLARHKSCGMTVLMLAVVRVVWRLTHRPPPPAGVSVLQHRAAQGAHGALYVLLFAMPLTGWLMSSAKNYSVSWFGLFTWPDLIGKNVATYKALHLTHEILSDALIVTVALHVAAAVLHHFWNQDDVLMRMLPFKDTGKRS